MKKAEEVTQQLADDRMQRDTKENKYHSVGKALLHYA